MSLDSLRARAASRARKRSQLRSTILWGICSIVCFTFSYLVWRLG